MLLAALGILLLWLPEREGILICPMAKLRRIKPFVSGAFHLLRLLEKPAGKREAMDILALGEISFLSSLRAPSPEDAPVRSLHQMKNTGVHYGAESF